MPVLPPPTFEAAAQPAVRRGTPSGGRVPLPRPAGVAVVLDTLDRRRAGFREMLRRRPQCPGCGEPGMRRAASVLPGDAAAGEGGDYRRRASAPRRAAADARTPSRHLDQPGLPTTDTRIQPDPPPRRVARQRLPLRPSTSPASPAGRQARRAGRAVGENGGKRGVQSPLDAEASAPLQARANRLLGGNSGDELAPAFSELVMLCRPPQQLHVAMPTAACRPRRLQNRGARRSAGPRAARPGGPPRLDARGCRPRRRLGVDVLPVLRPRAERGAGARGPGTARQAAAWRTPMVGALDLPGRHERGCRRACGVVQPHAESGADLGASPTWKPRRCRQLRAIGRRSCGSSTRLPTFGDPQAVALAGGPTACTKMISADSRARTCPPRRIACAVVRASADRRASTGGAADRARSRPGLRRPGTVRPVWPRDRRATRADRQQSAARRRCQDHADLLFVNRRRPR